MFKPCGHSSKVMIVGVISDTHGNRRLMHQVADYLRSRHKAELLIHVGDDYADAEELAMAGHTIKMVPGLWCPEYANYRIPNTIVESVDGITISATHADKDLRARELTATVVLTGHTHEARIEKLGRSIHLNPGHLKSKYDRGQYPSYALIKTDEDGVEVAIYEISGRIRESKRFQRAELG